MDGLDQEILQSFVEESREHLADVETELLRAEAAEGKTPPEVINQVFRCVHSIKGGAGFLGLERIKELSHQLENVVGLMREGQLVPSPQTITVLLQATDRLRELVEEVEQSNLMEIGPMLAALEGVLAPEPSPEPVEGLPTPPGQVEPPPELTELQGETATVEVAVLDGEEHFLAPVPPLVMALETDRFVYLVEFDPTNDTRLRGQEASQVLPELVQAGDILVSSVESVGTVSLDFPRFILFSTLLDPDLIAGLIPIEERFIRDLTQDLRRRLTELGCWPDDAPAADPGPPEEMPVTAASVADPGPEWHPLPETAAPAAAHAPEEPGAAHPLAEKGTGGASLRVHVSLLDRLMILAGELVLGRNQLLQTLGSEDTQAVHSVAQKINLVTSELQETVMLTRMQPVGLVFNKFPRVVRDLARSLGKEVALTMEGQEVELDKTIIEGLHDPLTHLVRNAVDHGIESPKKRRQAGKKSTGQLFLKAYHQAGLVILEIKDDGKGLDPQQLGDAAVAKGWLTADQNRSMSDAERLNVVFRPGFSTATKVTEVSGRGVGLDVVKSNLDKVGGQVEINSRVGEGTTFIIKLPLTLAIIPSLIVSAAGERFAIPQVNVQELLRIPAGQVKERLETVGDAVVVRLRGQLLPLLPLAEVTGLASRYLDPQDNVVKPERRRNLTDRRSRSSALVADEQESSAPTGSAADQAGVGDEEHRQAPDRRYHAASALCIAVVYAGPLRYGLLVDKFHGAEEIVIKPLGTHHKNCRACAGATIMGDGRVALDLDYQTLKQPGVMGSAIIDGHTTQLLDVFEFLEQLKPEWFNDRARAPEVSGPAPLVLLAEDSNFFRSQVKKFLSEAGYQVAEAEDGLKAWEVLQKHGDKVRLVVTDIEMPNLDGLGLTARIRGDKRFRHLPIIAVTSLAGEEDETRGRQAGVDDYQIKLDREQLLGKIDEFLRGGNPS